MKKILLLMLITLFSIGMTNANSVEVHNRTTCDVSVSLNGGGGIQTIPAGGIITYFSGGGLNITATKVYVSNVVGIVLVGYYTPYSISNFIPPCMTTFFNCKWDQSSLTSNVYLDIY